MVNNVIWKKNRITCYGDALSIPQQQSPAMSSCNTNCLCNYKIQLAQIDSENTQEQSINGEF